MDAARFDRLAQTLGARLTRRRGLGLLAAPGLLGLGETPLTVAKKKKGKTKKKKSVHCPGGRVRRRGQCRSCRNDGECGRQYDLIFGVCVNGRCKECETDPWCDFIWEGDFPYCIANDCKECRTNANCPAGQSCTNNRCVDACRNGVLDGDETDVDCGGPTCPRCATGQQCEIDSDCQSGSCVDECVGCGDGSQCKEAGQCTSNADCPSGVACVDGACTGTCVPPGAACGTPHPSCAECCGADDCSTGNGFVCAGFDGSCG